MCRDNVLLCSLRAFKRRFFNPEAKLDVVFVDEDDNGEGVVDEGGPTRVPKAVDEGRPPVKYL